ncbi:MAG: hypothetical protein XD98_0509 [Microgenomates bacterium 39_6]|nr:MAG: hypothetical protein XD98_0509 [Microgenomates bacterium 39_6]
MFSEEDLVCEARRLWKKLAIPNHNRLVLATNFHNEKVLALLALTASAVGCGVTIHQSSREGENPKITYVPIWGRQSWRLKRPNPDQIMRRVASGKTPESLPKNALEKLAKIIIKSDEIVFTTFV